MRIGIEVTSIARAKTICLIVVLTMYAVVACSSGNKPAPASVASTTIVMPDIVGMYWVQAEPKLRSLGWTGALVKGPDVPASLGDRNRVLSQSPPAGEDVDRDGNITVRFGS